MTTYDDLPYGDEWPDDPDADPYYTEQAERAAIKTFADDYPDYVSDCYENGTPPLPLYEWVAQRADAKIAAAERRAEEGPR